MAEQLPDGVTTETAYVARDGSRHRTLDGAVCRNETLARIKDANETLESGATIYDALVAYGYSKPAEVFKQATKDTPLVISFWQCRDEPGYKVSRFDLDGIFVWGHAGSWSGPYGNHVTVRDLERYVAGSLNWKGGPVY